MAFSWVQDISVGASIDAADVNEIKTNLDSIYTDLSITRDGCGSGAGWSDLPVSAGDPITSAQFQQMRAVTDYAYDNKCPNECSNHDSSVDSVDRGTHQVTDLGGRNLSGYNFNEDGTNYGTHQGTDLGGRNLSGYNFNEDSPYNSSACGTNRVGYDSTDLGGRNLSGYNFNEDSPYNTGACNSDMGGRHLSGYNLNEA